MALGNRCYLCGEKLKKGVCTACGLDNVRMTRQNYRLNETTPMSVKRQHVAAQKAQQIQYAREYKEKQSTLEDMGKPLNQKQPQKKKAAYNPNVRPKAKSSVPDKKSEKWAPLKVLGIIYTILAVIPAMGSCVFDLIEEFDFGAGTPEYISTDYDTLDVDLTYVQRELSETGDYFEDEFGPGCYHVGVHIPEGLYTIQLSLGS